MRSRGCAASDVLVVLAFILFVLLPALAWWLPNGRIVNCQAFTIRSLHFCERVYDK